MDVTKRLYQNLASKIIFLFLAFFPLGLLPSFGITLVNKNVAFHLVDILALVTLPILVIKTYKKPPFYTSFRAFVAICLFSLLFSLTLFSLPEVLAGSLYLIRFIAYFALFILTWNEVISGRIKRPLLFNSLILASVFTAVYGWIQYIFVPKFRLLKILGWDDHLFRLAGTFLDPGFTGIILVLGALLCLQNILAKKDKFSVLSFAFLTISIAFTYSRAAFIAYFVGIAVTLFLAKKTKLILVIMSLFILVLPLLPRPAGEGVRLERLVSGEQRVDNYKETLAIFKTSPIFGIGFNNLCSARSKLFSGDFTSHACSGSDSSLLTVLATTGVVGMFIFLNLFSLVFKSLNKNIYSTTLIVCSLSLIVDSLFVNSIFYPWVMGYIAMLIALAVKEKIG
jgi:hypothetical protein